MARGREETSTSGRPKGRLRATPSASSIISSLTMEELMAYCEVPDNIDLRLMERADESTLGGEHNGVFFTREHLVIGCCVLNHLYQLDLSLVELCIIYFLRVGQGSQMSMLVLNPRLQVVNGLPDLPKTEAKGVLLVRGPWVESPGSPGVPFDINQSQSFLGVWSG